MTSYPRIMVLLDDSASEIAVLRDNYLPAEVDQPGLSMPLGGAGGSDSPSLQELLRSEGDGFLEVRVSGQCFPNISEEPQCRAGNDNPLGSLEVEHLRAQEGDIAVIGGSAVVGAAREALGRPMRWPSWWCSEKSKRER